MKVADSRELLSEEIPFEYTVCFKMKEHIGHSVSIILFVLLRLVHTFAFFLWYEIKFLQILHGNFIVKVLMYLNIPCMRITWVRYY